MPFSYLPHWSSIVPYKPKILDFTSPHPHPPASLIFLLKNHPNSLLNACFSLLICICSVSLRRLFKYCSENILNKNIKSDSNLSNLSLKVALIARRWLTGTHYFIEPVTRKFNFAVTESSENRKQINPPTKLAEVKNQL